MTNSVTQLYPLPAQELPLKGLYLSHNLRQLAGERPFVYSNYVASLDGRIALPHPNQPGMTVPKQIANERDWRLFQELAVQADVLITSGRYLRDYVAGRGQEILTVLDDPQFADLKQWRLDQGLPPQPDLAVISSSLDFLIPDVLTQKGRSVLVFTSEMADPVRIKQMEKQASRVIVAGDAGVDGRSLIQHLAQMGYRTIKNSTGPQVLHLLLAANVLDRLYFTHAHRILGGIPFSTIVEGELLEPPLNFHLHSLYHDPHALEGAGQLFTAFNRF